MTVGEIYKIIIESEEQFTKEKNIYRLLDEMIKWFMYYFTYLYIKYIYKFKIYNIIDS